MAESSRTVLAVLPLLILGPGRSAAAVDIDGSATVATTATDNDGLESDLLEQQYGLSLTQALTPLLGLRFGYQHLDLHTTFRDGGDFRRRSRQPRLELLYNRRRLSARLAAFQQSIDNTLEAESFDRRSLAASLSWRPARGPGFNLNFRDDQNVADVSVFGRDVSSQILELTALYSRKRWAASYSFDRIALENRSNDLRTRQGRHELRLDASQGLWSDRFALGFSGRVSRLDRTVQVGEGTEIAEPVPAVEGLSGVDTTPELGELEPNPGLIDGDFETPASPPIAIGGANTFRNVGVDLGITRPLTRLEVGVDTVSGPQLVWQVYRSRDNLLWEPISGVTSRFDEVLLRYTLRFPETEDRFFKAVNVSVNPIPNVLVTELRALLDLDPADVAEGPQESQSDLYRADLVARFQPLERVQGAAGLGVSNDQTVTAGLVRRDFEEAHAFARLSVGLLRGLQLHLNYRFDDSENRRGPILLRTVNRYTASLDWKPLATVDALLTAGRRDETERGAPIQTLDSVRLAVVTELLPDLRLVSDLDFSTLEDAFAGTDRSSRTWRETVEMRPLPRWTLSGGFSFSSNETLEGEPLFSRSQYRIWTTWNATAYLTLGGTLWITDEADRRSTNQSFNVSYAPGDRLTIAAAYQGFDGSEGRGTFTDSLSLSYRLFRRFILFVNLTRSRNEQGEGEVAEISNLRAGLRLSF